MKITIEMNQFEAEAISIEYGYVDIMVFVGAMGFLIKFLLGTIASSFFICHIYQLVTEIKSKFLREKSLRIVNNHLDRLKIAN